MVTNNQATGRHGRDKNRPTTAPHVRVRHRPESSCASACRDLGPGPKPRGHWNGSIQFLKWGGSLGRLNRQSGTSKEETWDIGQKETSSMMLGDTKQDEKKDERTRDVEDKGTRSHTRGWGLRGRGARENGSETTSKDIMAGSFPKVTKDVTP